MTANVISGIEHRLERGDLFVGPSWTEYELTSGDGLDLFRLSDAPIFEALGLYRIQVGRR
jgi:gentisate 1,2-dioxygenase